MTRFYEYIKEDVDRDSITKTLEQHCKQYLNELTHCNGMLYRAIWNGSSKVTIANTPKERKSFRTNQQFQDAIDDVFIKKFGIALRGNTFSCSGNKNSIKRYGTVNAIFPIGGFEVYWSPRVSDFYLNAFDSRNKQSLEHKNMTWAKNMADTYIKGNLNAAIQSGNEIMLYCEKAILIPVESMSFRMIVEPYIIDLQRGL